MTMPPLVFAFLAALAIIASLGVILQRNPVHCVLSFALALTDIGVLFMGLGAVTVGFLQIVVYVGAIMVLFLFVIWLLNTQADALKPRGNLGIKFAGAIGAAVLAAELFVTFSSYPRMREIRTMPPDFGSIASVARMLFSDYLVAFEVTSLLLLASIVGAIALARTTTGAASPALPVTGGGDAPAGAPGASIASGAPARESA
ncbi:MAG TPA: NADH-quinone oxidoreductase subunit J [Candidatus Binataceae bacterium]|nr:NADH-quinone oxidoreductase subunit J [Candidatus Binataceae bacterium]